MDRDGAGEWPSKADEFNSMANSSAAATRSGSALRHRWIALHKHGGAGGANGLGNPTTGSSASASSTSGPRKRKREHTSLTYDEIVRLVDLDAPEFYDHIFQVLGAKPASSAQIGIRLAA